MINEFLVSLSTLTSMLMNISRLIIPKYIRKYKFSINELIFLRLAMRCETVYSIFKIYGITKHSYCTIENIK